MANHGGEMRFPKRRKKAKTDEEQPMIEETEEDTQDTGKPVPSITGDNTVDQEEETPMSAALNVETATEDELVGAIDDVMERLSIEHLVRVRGLADQRISSKREETRAQLLARFRAEAAEMGMSLFEVLPQPPQTTRRASGPTKVLYRGPNGEEYAGRGVNPRWLQALVNEGHSKEDFKIRDDGMTKWEEERQQAA